MIIARRVLLVPVAAEAGYDAAAHAGDEACDKSGAAGSAADTTAKDLFARWDASIAVTESWLEKRASADRDAEAAGEAEGARPVLHRQASGGAPEQRHELRMGRRRLDVACERSHATERGNTEVLGDDFFAL